MKFPKLFGRSRGLRKRYGPAGKRSEGVKVKRDAKRIYYVKKNGEVWSSARKNA